MKKSVFLHAILPEFYCPGYYFRIQWNDIPEVSVWKGPYITRAGAVSSAKQRKNMHRIGSIEIALK